jgi:hypothetical protein
VTHGRSGFLKNGPAADKTVLQALIAADYTCAHWANPMSRAVRICQHSKIGGGPLRSLQKIIVTGNIAINVGECPI